MKVGIKASGRFAVTRRPPRIRSVPPLLLSALCSFQAVAAVYLYVFVHSLLVCRSVRDLQLLHVPGGVPARRGSGKSLVMRVPVDVRCMPLCLYAFVACIYRYDSVHDSPV